MNDHPNNIVFIDGYCILCNRLVSFLNSLDKKHIFYYCTITSDYAITHMGYNYRSLYEKDSVIFYKNNKYFVKSEAIFEIMKSLGFPYNLLTFFKILPSYPLNLAYDYVAKYRYKIFGKKNICNLPSTLDKLQILE